MESKESHTGAGVLLFLSMVLGIVLFFPVILQLDVDSDLVRGSMITETMKDMRIHYLSVAGASVLIPLFLDNIIDMLFSGVNLLAIVRTSYIFFFLLSFVGQIIVLNSPSSYAAYFIFIVLYQVWLLLSLAVILLNRVLRGYTLYTSAVIGALTYIFLFGSVWYVTFQDEKSLQLIQIMRFVSGISVLLSLLPSALQVLLDIRTSKLRLWDFILSNDDRTKISAIITCALVAVVVTMIIASAALSQNGQEGPLSLSSDTLIVYFSSVIIYVILVTVLPRHIAKVHQANTLKSSLALKKTFMNFISHELRTSFTIILGGLEVIEQQTMDGNHSVDLQSTIKELKGSCSTGVDILNEFLDFEKLDAGLGTVEKTVQNPLEIIQSAVSPFQLLAMKKGITLELLNLIGSSACEVDVDEIKVAYIGSSFISSSNNCRFATSFVIFYRTQSSSLRPVAGLAFI